MGKVLHTPDSNPFRFEQLCMAAAMAEEEVGQAQLTQCWWGEGKGGSSTDKGYKGKEEEGKDVKRARRDKSWHRSRV